jgi:hypothetical protein
MHQMQHFRHTLNPISFRGAAHVWPMRSAPNYFVLQYVTGMSLHVTANLMTIDRRKGS